MSPFIETFTGQRFQPLSPDPASIRLEDIAHALSQECRFSNHVREFYSVAEHSVRVSELLEEQGEDEEVQFWGLMHDASEAYLVELPAPLKDTQFGEEYRKVEAVLMRTICQRFGMSENEPECVRLADLTLRATEARDLMAFKPAHWRGLTAQPLEQRISTWTPKIAEFRFLERFRELDRRR